MYTEGNQMLTPENAGCPKCFAPLSSQTAKLDIICKRTLDGINENGNPIFGNVIDQMDENFYTYSCLECGEYYDELHERNAHEMAAYAEAQSEE